MIIMHLFVVQNIVILTHGDTQYIVNKQCIESHTFRRQKLSVDPGRRCFLEENKFSFSLYLISTIISANQFIVQQKVLKKSVNKKCPQKVSTKVSIKSVPKKCPQKNPIISVQIKCPQKVSTTSFKKCPQYSPQQVSTKSVP